jgi:mannose-6-phosphate isomerase
MGKKMVIPNKIKRIDKPWGYEEILEKNRKYTVKRLLMKKGNKCSLQYHKKKQETIVSLSGNLLVQLEITLKPGESLTILPGQVHRMIAKSGNCLYLESSTSELDDVVRIQDDYGRCKK